jgi:hypothetical protein
LLEKIVIRRDFIKNTALAGSLAALPLLASGTNAGTAGSSVAPAVFGSRKVNFDFRTYRDTVSACPVYSITPDDGYYLHTFYDICPWSPSQRYFVCTKFPFQDREPDHRDEAQICVIDMKDRTLTEVYSTAAWGFQLGSNVQWGGTDRHLYFNDKVDGEGVCVRLDLETGKAEPLAGPMYHIAPDESAIVSFPLDLINQTQAGYGYAVDPARIRKMKPGAAENEGIWRTDLKTNKKTLLVSLAEAYEVLPDSDKKRFKGGTFYFFHSKFNPQGTKILQVFRGVLPDAGSEFGIGGTGQFKPSLITFWHRPVQAVIDHVQCRWLGDQTRLAQRGLGQGGTPSQLAPGRRADPDESEARLRLDQVLQFPPRWLGLQGAE